MKINIGRFYDQIDYLEIDIDNGEKESRRRIRCRNSWVAEKRRADFPR